MKKDIEYDIGFWAAILVTACAVGFVLCFFIGLLYKNTDKIAFGLCMFLSIGFVGLMATNYSITSGKRKIWGLLGLTFSIIYSSLVSIVYFIQLAVVYNDSIMALSQETLKLIIFVPGSVLFSVNMLGYFFMSISTLFGAFAFRNEKLERIIKWLFIANGFFAITSFILPMLSLNHDPYSSMDIINIIENIIHLIWCAYFSVISIFLIIYYKNHLYL